MLAAEAHGHYGNARRSDGLEGDPPGTEAPPPEEEGKVVFHGSGIFLLRCSFRALEQVALLACPSSVRPLYSYTEEDTATYLRLEYSECAGQSVSSFLP